MTEKASKQRGRLTFLKSFVNDSGVKEKRVNKKRSDYWSDSNSDDEAAVIHPPSPRFALVDCPMQCIANGRSAEYLRLNCEVCLSI